MNDEFKAELTATFGEVQIIHQDSVASNTTDGWNSQRDLISKKNVLYVYTDYRQTEDEEGNVKNIPGIKIGDGKAYLIDLPFVNDIYLSHINDSTIHVTQSEKNSWNNKVMCYISGKRLIFTTE
jgi:hypothetical protein